MNLLKRIDRYYFLATRKFAQLIDKTKVGPMRIDPYGDRIVVSDRDTFDLTPKKYPQSASTRNNKPVGIWYAFGTQWITHMGLQGDYAYRIKIDDSNLLKLDANNIEEFIEAYKTSIKGEDVARSIGVDLDKLPEHMRLAVQVLYKDTHAIDWGKVASKHTGVEITGLMEMPSRLNWEFLSSWDVDSGCIFDTSIVKGAEKLGELPVFEEGSHSPEFMGYWEEDPSDIQDIFEGKQGKVMGSSLTNEDRRFLSTRLTQYDIHLTPEQLKGVEFLVTPNSVTLKKVPGNTSYEGRVINT